MFHSGQNFVMHGRTKKIIVYSFCRSGFQWECKADLDNAYRFGQIEVVCEGYSYPEDPNILVGSCGVSTFEM